jgi:hypothetical protein
VLGMTGGRRKAPGVAMGAEARRDHSVEREERERERSEREKRGGRKAEQWFKFMPVAPIGLA